MKPVSFISLLTLLTSFLACATGDLHTATRQNAPFSFHDVTREIGLAPREESLKWGGPCVADLNADGIYDIAFSYHGQYPIQIFWGNGDGTFTEDAFSEKADIHGVSAGPRSATTRERILTINVGGGRGNKPRPPQNYLITPGKKITNITHSYGLGKRTGRGRLTVFMDLAPGKKNVGDGPDLIVASFLGAKEDGVKQYGYENKNGEYVVKDLVGYEDDKNTRPVPVDVDGDGVMEIFTAPAARIYQVVAPFKFKDVTGKFLNSDEFKDKTISSIAELDIDNDGKFEIYLARAREEDLLPFGDGGNPADVLLQQKNGRLIDISGVAGIPATTRSVGVTAADFDNDGYVDLFVSLLFGKDMLLKNNGDGTFQRINGLVPKGKGVRGQHAVAVDYDEDGRVDLIVAQGAKKNNFGPYRVMRNLTPKTANRHYLLVRVGHHPGRVATALHAVITVKVGDMTMVRRVGSPGTQSEGPAFLDTVHFGLGSFEKVDSVKVKWTVGPPLIKRGVGADQKVTFGIV